MKRWMQVVIAVATAGCVQSIQHATPDGGMTPDGGTGVCTFGQDQTCNDLSTVSTLWGHCTSQGQCQCNAGFGNDPSTGKCRPTAVDAGGAAYCWVNGTWLAPDGGVASGGQCAFGACAVDCDCVAQGSGAQCLCTGAVPPDAGIICTQPSCGPIWCDAPCACLDAATGTCACPSSAPDGGMPSDAGCTFGQNFTCDDVISQAVWGVCNANGTCTCNAGFVNDPGSGLCMPAGGILCSFASPPPTACFANLCPAGDLCSSAIAADGGTVIFNSTRDGRCHRPCDPAHPSNCMTSETCTQLGAYWDCQNLTLQWVCCPATGCL